MRAFTIMALVLWPLSASPTAMAEEIGIGPLRIVLDPEGRDAPKPAAKSAKDTYAQDFKRACRSLGQALTAEKGPYGFGAFRTYSCYRGDKKLSGSEAPAEWVLTILDGEKTATLTLAYDDGRHSTPVTHISMPPSLSTLAFFADPEFTDLVAFALLSSAPMGLAVTPAQVKGDPPALTGRYWRAGGAKKFKYKVPEAPGHLVVYRLQWDSDAKIWTSQVVGTASRGTVTEPKKKRTKGKKGQKGGTILVGGSVEYTTSTAVSDAAAHGPLWAQDAEGPGARQQELHTAIARAQRNLDTAAGNGHLEDFMKGNADLLTDLFATAASGYVGLRYGLEVIPGIGELGKLLSKTHTFGLLAEIRGGPLEGIRYYYDLLPKTSATLSGIAGPVDTSIAFSRHVLGYAWDFSPGLLVDRITAEPKFGLWTFNATLPTALDSSGNVLQVGSFNLGRTFSLGFELGVEELSRWYTLRGFYAINTGYSLIRTGGKITSNSFGIDAYFTAGPTMPLFGVPFKTALLAFYVYESVDIVSNKVASPSPGQEAISGLAYDAGYAGGGIAISW